MSRLIDMDKLRKPIYAEDDNITGAGMSLDEIYGYNDGIDAAWGVIDRAEVVDAIPIAELKDCFAEDMERLRNAIKSGDVCLACLGKAYGKCCTCIDNDNFELISTMHDTIYI